MKVKFITITTDETYLIDGANVFEGVDTGKTCTVFHPEYGTRRKADIYEVQGKTETFKVAIAEFSMCAYGIYLVGGGGKGRESPFEMWFTPQKAGYSAVILSILTAISALVVLETEMTFLFFLPALFLLSFIAVTVYYLVKTLEKNRADFFAPAKKMEKDLDQDDSDRYSDVENEFDTALAKIDWETVDKILSKEKIPIDVYTLNAYIERFKEMELFGEREINRIDKWLTKNFDALEDGLKNAVIEFFLEKSDFSWLNASCVDASRREEGVRKVRFATIKYLSCSLPAETLRDYVELTDGFGSRIDEALDVPVDLYNLILNGKEKAGQVVENWLAEEKAGLLKRAENEPVGNKKYILSVMTNNLRYTDAIAADPYIVKEDETSYCPKCKRMSFGLNWYPPYKIEVYKRNIGDIVLGAGSVIVSKKFKDVYEQNGLTGIKEFCRIESVKSKGVETDSELYYVKLNRYEVPIDYEKSRMEGDDTDWQCDLCNPDGKIDVYINGIYFQKDFPADIFHMFAFGDRIFLSEKFISVMENNGITNLNKNYTQCDEYIQPTWPKDFFEKAKALRK
ncbi:MAG: hypothetical protein K5753_06640 [Clostridia bacterium]|nr:hypothetical protein [Clostridia bacterium]